ncbi:sigma-70 family RNA polymerase sigma factor [candidate division KSB1 bacterium]|nr:sigma-70 family RNA polymerase sigma factor [candidate division KSB1 bacterium]
MERREAILIKRSQQGSQQAFEELVAMYDRRITALIYHFLHDTEDVKDAYQEIFLRAFQGIPGFKFKSEFSSWLYKIAVNFCINYLKKQKRYQTFSLDEQLREGGDFWKVVLPDSGKTPEDEYLNFELQDHINQILAQLSARQRSVFILKHYQGLKLAEIAEILDCQVGTVKNYLFRAVLKMRDALEKY